jgi:hypothetical protein
LGPTLKGNKEKPNIKPLISVSIMFELWLVFDYLGVFGRFILLIFCKLGFNFCVTNGFFISQQSEMMGFKFIHDCDDDNHNYI